MHVKKTGSPSPESTQTTTATGPSAESSTQPYRSSPAVRHTPQVSSAARTVTVSTRAVPTYDPLLGAALLAMNQALQPAADEGEYSGGDSSKDDLPPFASPLRTDVELSDWLPGVLSYSPVPMPVASDAPEVITEKEERNESVCETQQAALPSRAGGGDKAGVVQCLTVAPPAQTQGETPSVVSTAVPTGITIPTAVQAEAAFSPAPPEDILTIAMTEIMPLVGDPDDQARMAESVVWLETPVSMEATPEGVSQPKKRK